jgi:uncharacterized membrane protein
MPSEQPAPARPRAVDLSYWLWFGACVFGMITTVATLRYFGELQTIVLTIIEQQYPLETAVTREKAAWATVATLIGAGALIILVQLLLALAMRSGRGWARFTLVGFTVLGALYGVVVLGAAPTISRAGLLASIAMMVIASVPMFLPATRPWFARRRIARSRGYSGDDDNQL